MKMSEYFSGKVKAEDCTKGLDSTWFGLVDGGQMVRSKGQMDAAAHAINQHDALIAMNAELVEALNLTLTSACDPYACSEDFCESILETLAKAKELAQ